MNPVSRDELRDLLHAGSTVLLEALPAAAFEAEHIPGAVNVPADMAPELDWLEAGLPLEGTRTTMAAR